MPSDSAPEDDQVRLSYNFAPGYYGMVYRADVPDAGNGAPVEGAHTNVDERESQGDNSAATEVSAEDASDSPHYKLQAMKWGMFEFLPNSFLDKLTIHRIDTVLDEAQPGFWLHGQDHQLSRRFFDRGSRYVEHDEEKEAMYRRLSRLL